MEPDNNPNLNFDNLSFWKDMNKLGKEMEGDPALMHQFDTDPGSVLENRGIDITVGVKEDGTELKFSEYLKEFKGEDAEAAARILKNEAKLPPGSQSIVWGAANLFYAANVVKEVNGIESANAIGHLNMFWNANWRYNANTDGAGDPPAPEPEPQPKPSGGNPDNGGNDPPGGNDPETPDDDDPGVCGPDDPDDDGPGVCGPDDPGDDGPGVCGPDDPGDDGPGVCGPDDPGGTSGGGDDDDGGVCGPDDGGDENRVNPDFVRGGGAVGTILSGVGGSAVKGTGGSLINGTGTNYIKGTGAPGEMIDGAGGNLVKGTGDMIQGAGGNYVKGTGAPGEMIDGTGGNLVKGSGDMIQGAGGNYVKGAGASVISSYTSAQMDAHATVFGTGKIGVESNAVAKVQGSGELVHGAGDIVHGAGGNLVKGTGDVIHGAGGNYVKSTGDMMFAANISASASAQMDVHGVALGDGKIGVDSNAVARVQGSGELVHGAGDVLRGAEIYVAVAESASVSLALYVTSGKVGIDANAVASVRGAGDETIGVDANIAANIAGTGEIVPEHPPQGDKPELIEWPDEPIRPERPDITEEWKKPAPADTAGEPEPSFPITDTDGGDVGDSTTEPIKPFRRPKFWYYLSAVLAGVVLLGTYFGWSGTVAKRARDVKIDAPGEIVLDVGDSADIEYTVTPTNAKVRLEASGDAFTLDGETVKAVQAGEGTVTITATYPKLAWLGGHLFRYRPSQADVNIIVKEPVEYDVKFPGRAVNLTVGDKYAFNIGDIEVEPYYKLTADDVRFSLIGNDDVISVSDKGVVTANAPGRAEMLVTVTIDDREFGGQVTFMVAEPETETETIHEHSWTVTNVVQPTCTSAGYRDYRCSCGETMRESVGSALGHDYVKSANSTEPSCTEAGRYIYVCSRCGDTREESIPALGHKWKRDEATATHIREICERCGTEKQ